MLVIQMVSKNRIKQLKQQLQPLLKDDLVVNVYYETDQAGIFENRSTGEVVPEEEMQDDEHILNVLVVKAATK